ncbi:MAG: VCBS repeat-containing protein, partial [Actinomycetales bacterium]|nr:VCBS repeat-containing protein [Actinomycetales bacterium]
VAWYENQGGGVFGAQQVITQGAIEPFSVYATDLDGDGDADVLSASGFDNKIAWYENLLDLFDCNGNGVIDSVDISAGTSLDDNGNGIPDECESIGTRYCTASANSSGLPGELTVIGSDLLSQNDVTLTARQLPLQSFGFFLTSLTQGFTTNVPNSQGTLCLAGNVGRFVGPGQIQNSGADGAIFLGINL